MIPKKGGEWRMCIDYRKLNEVTIADAYPIPNITELLEHLISLDLKAGFHQIPMEDSDKEKTAFATRNGLYQFTVREAASDIVT
jgi:TPP-dependent indolepyruvate ferredoxin oxidoreductase alpha subunit